MSHLLFSFQVVCPLFIYMGLGALLKKSGWFPAQLGDLLTHLVYRFFLPLYLFLSIGTHPLPGGAEGGGGMAFLALFAVCAVLLTFFLFWALYDHRTMDRRQKGVMIQSSYRTNFALFGVALSQLILKTDQGSLTALLLPFVIPLFNVLSVFILAYYSASVFEPKAVVQKLAHNPLILGIVAGLLIHLLPGPLPSFLLLPLDRLGQAATPLALLALGYNFTFQSLRHYRALLVESLLIRLLFVPAFFLGLALLLGFRGESLVALLTLFASPVAVSSYAMAEGLGQDGTLAGQILAASSAFCGFSLFLFLSLLRLGGFL